MKFSQTNLFWQQMETTPHELLERKREESEKQKAHDKK
jgi:hypothetical protein